MRAEFRTAIVFGVVIAAAVGIMTAVFSSLEGQSWQAGPADTAAGTDKSKFRAAPDLAGIAHYLNTTPEGLAEDMEGKVVLYDIWTYSCINCIRTLPHITAWHDKYSDEGLLIVGVHSPEFEFEKDPRNVEMAVDRHGITYPVVMDNDRETWKAFENRYWPRKYVADHEGYIRYDHIGEGAYQETEKIIQRLLEERAASLGLQAASARPLVDIDEFEHAGSRTPEIYLGYKFAHGRSQIGSDEGFSPGNVVTYGEPDSTQLHRFYPVGTWKNAADSMHLESDAGAIKLRYAAKQVNVVTANSAEIEVFLDGEPLPAEYAGADVAGTSRLVVGEPGLYNIIDSDSPSSHVLELRIRGQGLQVFTFTFG